MFAMMCRQHKGLKIYLASTHPTTSSSSLPSLRKAHLLPLVQLYEYSTDIHADLRRRQEVDVYELQYQPPAKEWPEQRQQVQNVLTSLDEETYRVLVVDLVNETERRFPVFKVVNAVQGPSTP